MKKIFSLVLTCVLLAGCVFAATGCNKKEKEGKKKDKKDDTVVISYEHGKGVFKLSVPKDEEGNAKYAFTKEKPAEISTSATFYLVTDKAVFGFSTAGMTYNTSKAYKDKYGETKATFDGYLEYINSEDFNKKIYLPGCEELKLNGRNAIRYYNRTGGSGEYKYYGYFYLIDVDDIYTGSRAQMIVNYKEEEKPTEIKELDKETLSIIKSLKIESNTK